MKIFLTLFPRTVLSKIACCALLILCISLPAAFAKDNRTKYEEAKERSKLLLEPDIQYFKEQHQKALQRMQLDLDAIPVQPKAKKGEPLAVSKLREDRAKIVNLISKFTDRLIYAEKYFKSFPFYIYSIDADPAIVSYARRIEERIDKYTANQSFKINGASLRGSAYIYFVVSEDGRLETVGVNKSTTDQAFGEFIVKLMNELAPFEPFPDDVASQGNLMIFNREFNFTKE